MRVTASFANPYLVMTYTVSLLAIGWVIGAHWGYSLTSGWMLFFGTIFLSLHDAAIAVLLAMAATKAAASGKN